LTVQRHQAAQKMTHNNCIVLYCSLSNCEHAFKFE